MAIIGKKYASLNEDPLFIEKLQEMCAIVKPDSNFYEKIKQKELWLLDSGNIAKDYENAPTVESLDNNKDTKNHNTIVPSQFKIQVTKAKSIEIDADGRFDLSDDEDINQPKKQYFDDLNLGSKAKPMQAADFSGGGNSGDDYIMDLFEILNVPDCSAFYMTGIYNCTFFNSLADSYPFRHIFLHWST